jgi:FkbM family methyltransferase
MNIIQIGCHKGQDRVQSFIEQNYENINKAILIDANKECIDACKESYKHLPKVDFLQYAIIPSDETTVNFYIPTESLQVAEQGSVSKEFIETGNLPYRTVITPSTNLNKLFKEQNINKIDRLYIDAEALDIDIINSINFAAVDIRFLFFEKLHSDYRLSHGGKKYENCIEKLKKLGYEVHDQDWDSLAIKTIS